MMLYLVDQGLADEALEVLRAEQTAIFLTALLTLKIFHINNKPGVYIFHFAGHNSVYKTIIRLHVNVFYNL